MAESIDLTAKDLWLVTRMEAAGWQMVPAQASDWMIAAGDAVAPGLAREVWDAMMCQAPPLGRHVD